MEFASTWRSSFGTDARDHGAAQARARRDRAGHQRRRLRRLARRDPTLGRRHPATRSGAAEHSAEAVGAPAARSPTGARTATARARRPGHARATLQYGVDPNRNYGQAGAARAPAPTRTPRPTAAPARGRSPRPRPSTSSRRRTTSRADHAAQLRLARAAPAGPAHRRARRPTRTRLKALGDADGRRHRLHVAVRLPALRHLGHDRGLELRRGRHATATRSRSARPTAGRQLPHPLRHGRRRAVDRHRRPRAGRGLRKALLRIAEGAASRPDLSDALGRAPAGRILRLKKTFKTSSSPVCQFATVD